jgi:hypothetical protein
LALVLEEEEVEESMGKLYIGELAG